MKFRFEMNGPINKGIIHIMICKKTLILFEIEKFSLW